MIAIKTYQRVFVKAVDLKISGLWINKCFRSRFSDLPSDAVKANKKADLFT